MSTESTIAQDAERPAAAFREMREGLSVAYGLATGTLEFTPERGKLSEATEAELADALRVAHDYALKYMLDKYAWIDVARLAIRLVGNAQGEGARAIVGFVVVDIKTGAIDWDCELHPTREAAIESLTGPHHMWCRTPEEATDERTYYGEVYEILKVAR